MCLFLCVVVVVVVVQMEAEAHDWVLPVMSAHLQAEKNKTLGKEGPDHFFSLFTGAAASHIVCLISSPSNRLPVS